MRTLTLGTFFGLTISFRPLFFVSSLLLWLILTGLGLTVLKLNPFITWWGALVAVILHWLSEFLHHIGHALAARRTGFPMSGVRFGFLIGASVYPPTEPELPASVHIRRALGGPLM